MKISSVVLVGSTILALSLSSCQTAPSPTAAAPNPSPEVTASPEPVESEKPAREDGLLAPPTYTDNAVCLREFGSRCSELEASPEADPKAKEAEEVCQKLFGTACAMVRRKDGEELTASPSPSPSASEEPEEEASPSPTPSPTTTPAPELLELTASQLGVNGEDGSMVVSGDVDFVEILYEAPIKLYFFRIKETSDSKLKAVIDGDKPADLTPSTPCTADVGCRYGFPAYDAMEVTLPGGKKVTITFMDKKIKEERTKTSNFTLE